MDSVAGDGSSLPPGFPIRKSPDKLAYNYPRLIAVSHVLHRLLSPRHPPYALSSLTTKFTRNQILSLQETIKSQSRAALLECFRALLPAAPRKRRAERAKTTQRLLHRVDLSPNRLFLRYSVFKERFGALRQASERKLRAKSALELLPAATKDGGRGWI